MSMAHRALVVDEYEHHRCASIHATVPTRAARDPTHGPTRAIPDPPAHLRYTVNELADASIE